MFRFFYLVLDSRLEVTEKNDGLFVLELVELHRRAFQVVIHLRQENGRSSNFVF